jgi:hypothetical protein
METNRITAPPAGLAGAVTTFYSYDSAPARSLALAHAGWLLAGRTQAKTPVLMIDWDLEAPGLHHYFLHPQDGQAAPRRAPGGLLELFETCREHLGRAAGSSGAMAAGEDPDTLAARVLGALDWDDYIERVDDSRPLFLMRAGRFDDSYGERVDGLDWDALFGACPALFRSFAAHLARRFAHVLVDCRSGRSAAASVCTALLPDKIVALFSPDARSLDGVRGVLGRALDYRCSHEDEQRPLMVYPLPCPTEGAGDQRLRWRFGDGQRAVPGYQAALERLLAGCYGLGGVTLDSYLDEVQLPMASILNAAPPTGRMRAGDGDRLGPQRCIGRLLEWLEPGHFPWRPLAEVRLVQAVDAADPQAPALVRELARLAQSYLGQQGELEAARRIEQHVIALEQGLHAMEEGKRGHAALRRPGEVPRDMPHDMLPEAMPEALSNPLPNPLAEKLSRLQELIDGRSPREARALADSLRATILRPSVAHPLRRRGAAMIKHVYLQEGDKDALLAFTQDEVASLEGALIQATNGQVLVTS